jgi:hypothetical protein
MTKPLKIKVLRSLKFAGLPFGNTSSGSISLPKTVKLEECRKQLKKFDILSQSKLSKLTRKTDPCE